MKRAPAGTARCCAGFPSLAEQYHEPPLDLNELLVKRPAATYFVFSVTFMLFVCVALHMTLYDKTLQHTPFRGADSTKPL